MTGRTGASPIPPATIMMSLPLASTTGHDDPYGPLMPITAPGRRAQMALVTAPTARTVWTSVSGCDGLPAIEKIELADAHGFRCQSGHCHISLKWTLSVLNHMMT